MESKNKENIPCSNVKLFFYMKCELCKKCVNVLIGTKNEICWYTYKKITCIKKKKIAKHFFTPYQLICKLIICKMKLH